MTPLFAAGLVVGWLLLLLGSYAILRVLEAACPPFRRWVAEWDDEPPAGRPY